MTSSSMVLPHIAGNASGRSHSVAGLRLHSPNDAAPGAHSRLRWESEVASSSSEDLVVNDPFSRN